VAAVKRLAVGISPCPNDTFAFHALLERRIETPGLELAFELCDIEQLNRRFLAGSFDACKVSFAALAERPAIRVLSAGAALGFGVGPMLIAARGARLERSAGGRPRIPAGARVLSPGEHTSAQLLYRLFHAGEGRVEQAVFSAILPALAAREADFGVCIHEGRFTYAELGLELVEDLGARWEEREALPLPLGGIAVREDLAPESAAALEDAIRRSIDYAHARREEALVTMRRHAQADSDAVLWKHVELYVNDWTRELGSEGARALARLRELASAQLP
jgi:1,4-dihydroxy-6-naphthoate synthase